MFAFSKEQVSLRESVRELVNRHIEKGAHERNNKQEYPAGVLKKLGELGYKGLLVPPEYDGAGLDVVSSMIVINEIARSDAAVAHMVATVNFGFAYPVIVYGTREQKEKYLRPCALGEKEGNFAYVEPQTEIRTVFKPAGNRFVLNGSKSMITNAPFADFAMVAATSEEPVEERERLSAFIVDLKSPGVEIGQAEETMGLQSLRIADMFFNNVTLDEGSLLGKVNQGMEIITNATNLARISNCAIALGIAERAYEEALAYAKIRKIYSTYLIDMQYVKYNFADMKADLELMRLATFNAASLFGQAGQNDFLNCCITKLKITEKAKAICDYCLQLFGGYGYIRGNILERLYRDIRAVTILGGDPDRIKSFISIFV
ncbi:MAG: acyl-CoA dehydrogenase family protein [Peptococcaceae bacterium]|jgi:alkylation response protein AidB-like acyl-CoA dehydrogenase|nr:acyl-CoA/acyl-ACP dehydrogenase [Peptococcaceae bacterium]MDH7525022.1 acyl-CoA dehydrogenase family protein [Peptococcaceae bacterium]